jgi:hypothetical protein
MQEDDLGAMLHFISKLGADGQNHVVVGIQNKEFRPYGISNLRPELKWGYWADCAKGVCALLARLPRSGLLARITSG